jgi:hypothetical protein
MQNYTQVHANFFLTMTDPITSQNIKRFYWIALYILYRFKDLNCCVFVQI